MANTGQQYVELGKNVSFDVLFKENLNPEKILPVVRQCLSVSKNDSEIIRAVELALCTCVKNCALNDLENIFEVACPAGASMFVNRVKLLEEQSNPIADECIASFDFCLKIVAYFHGTFAYLNEVEKVAISRVESLLKSSLDILRKCFTHCKDSKEVYGAAFDSLTDCLSGFFKSCCQLLDVLLNFLTEKCELDFESEWEISLLDEFLMEISKCGIDMIDLEVKAMAKIWKAYICLLEKYLCVLKLKHKVGDIISALCDVVISNVEAFKDKDNGRLVKLSCFLLKLIIKLCETFKSELGKCHGSLFNLFLKLCKYNCEVEENPDEDFASQLTTGADPLLSFVLTDENLVKEFASCQVVQNEEFCVLCCMVLKKLSHSSADVRCLWINETDNIFDWLFKAASSSRFIGFSSVRLPSALINYQRLTFTDLYEYVLVTVSAFLMTASAVEFCIVEKTLIRNVLQPNFIPALLATDIWCFLARIADSDLCYNQILTLSEMYKKFRIGTKRVEKCFLSSLIRRLFIFLTGSEQKEYLKRFSPSFHSSVWSVREVDCIPLDEVCGVIRPIISRCGSLIRKPECRLTSNKNKHLIYLTFGGQILDLWKFNCELLSSSSECVKFLKIACELVACIAPFATPEELLPVLCQMKKLLSVRGQPTAVKLYLAWVLMALSSVSVPSGESQKQTLLTIAEIFRELLSSRETLAKQKALEIFESFTRATAHEEVIIMTVQNSPELKTEMMSYFKKKSFDQCPDGFDEYLRLLFQLKYEHVCEQKELEPGLSLKRIKLDVPDLEEVVERFREHGDVIREHAPSLSEIQKKEIKSICSFILSKVQ